MPTIRFVSGDHRFETSIDSQDVPRVGERVQLLEDGLNVGYRVMAVTWNFAKEPHGCLLGVDRELHNPCTKCRQWRAALKPVTEPDPPDEAEVIVGWECADCNWPLHHDGQPKPVPDPAIAKLPWLY